MMFIGRLRCVTVVSVVASGGALAGPVEVLAVSGEPIAGLGGESFTRFASVVIDDDGAVYTRVDNGSNADESVLRFGPDGSVQVILRENDVDPGVGFSVLPSQLVVAKNGLAGGVVVAGRSTADQNLTGMIKVDSNGPIALHVDNAPTPLGELRIGGGDQILINRSGLVSYSATTDGDSGAADLIVRNDNGVLTEVVREGDPLPGGGGFVTLTGTRDFESLGLNDSGAQCYVDDDRLYRVAPDGSTETIAVSGGEAPFGSLSRYNSAVGNTNATINSSGAIGYEAEGFIDPVGGGAPDSFSAAFLNTGSEVFARSTGDAAPTMGGDDIGTLLAIGDSIRLTDAGILAFGASTSEPGGSQDGVFVFDGSSTNAVIRRGQPVPGGGEVFSTLRSRPFATSDAGHVLINLEILDDNNNRLWALFLYSPSTGTQRLLTEGDIIDGSPVSVIFDVDTTIGGASAVNTDGLATTLVDLADGRRLLVRFGAEPCLADVNMNGTVEPTDFGAWLAAFNAGDPAADQNLDGQVTPTDFGAWLANFNAGCD